jgi:hypothetical protein
MSNVLWVDSTVLHATDETTNRGAIGITSQGPGVLNDIAFVNITIESVQGASHFPIRVDNAFLEDSSVPTGAISNVTFSNVHVIACELCTVLVEGYSQTSNVSTVLFSNVTLAGSPLQLVNASQLEMEDFVVQDTILVTP